MGKKKAPAPPDPRETAAAQTGTNIGTAISNAMMGNVNQVTPEGSLTYDQTGTFDFRDPYTGQTYNIPRFTATQTYSPEQQALNQQNTATQMGLSRLAGERTNFLQNYLNQPFSLDNEATESRLWELGRKRLDPAFADSEDALRTRLTNQGLREGTEAYDREMRRFTEGRNDAYNQLMLSGRGQAVQEAMTERNQPINEIIALLSGSQVSQPQFVPTGQPNIPTTNVAGIINDDYRTRYGIYEDEMAQRNDLMGGLFGGAAGIMRGLPTLSDKRAKENIEKVGKVDGHNVYRYNYKGEPEGTPKSMGVMAQEVEKKRPDAVARGPDGLRRVNYGELFGAAA